MIHILHCVFFYHYYANLLKKQRELYIFNAKSRNPYKLK